MLGDLLGRGGMAEVFAGHSLGSHGFQKPVAIKRLLPELANDHVFVERLIGEAKLLVGMQHGNVVSVLDLARDGDDVFLVMEFVDGPSLRQLLKARGPRPLPLGVATYIVQSAAAGLEFAHARPGGAVIHADISPSNLLLTTSGEVRVADFGIARREGRLTGAVEGKWAYMAPEQARGESLTPGSDVFALGVVLYELITGQHPIGHRVTPDVRELEPVRVTPPRVVKPGVPAGIDAICMKALAHDPRDRYARMQHLIDALVDERFANGYREGANDLAQLIREMRPGAAPEVRTQVTDRPVTIMTRSLISSPARMSSPRLGLTAADGAGDRTAPPFGGAAGRAHVPAGDGASLAGSQSAGSLPTDTLPTGPMPAGAPAVAPSALPTVFARPAPLLSSGARTIELPGGIVPGPELASVHGGATITGTGHLDVRDARGPRWTLAVLGVAALVGVIAAVAIQLAPDAIADTKPAPAPAPARVAEAPIVTPIPTAPAPDTERTPVASAPDPGSAPNPVASAPDPGPSVPAADPAPVPAGDPAPVPDPGRAPAAAHSRAPSAHSDLAIRHARPAPPTRKPQEEAVLRVKTYDEQWVAAQIGSDLQYTPGAKFKLAPGSYTVRLKNDSYHGTCGVTLAPGQVRTLVVNMEEGACELR